MNKQQLLERVDKAWEDLKQSYAGLSEHELTEAGVMGDWSVKDIIAHVTWWEEEALKYLPVLLKGGTPPRYSALYGGIDAFNTLMTQRKRSLSLAEVLQERNDTHRRLIKFIQDAPEDQCRREDGFRRRLRLDTYAHYSLHAEAIRRWRHNRSS